MANTSTVYLNEPTLATATAVYTDVNLTTLAPDGFYSDNTIVRQQVSGVLQPVQSCPACSYSANLCYSTVNIFDACCGCSTPQ